MKEYDTYFNLFSGKPALYSEITPIVKSAVEVFIFDRKLFAQQRLFDKDELIIPAKVLRYEEPS